MCSLVLLLCIALLAVASSSEQNYWARCFKRFEDGNGWLNSSQLVRGTRDDCHWTIQQRGVYVAQFTLMGLSIVASPNCSTDYLAVRDEADGTVLMRVCGSELPENTTVTSQGNALTVHLKSSSISHTNSFNASYDQKCGAILYADESEHEYEQILEHNCTWTVTTKNPSQRVLVEVELKRSANKPDWYVDIWEENDIAGHNRLRLASPGRHVLVSQGGPVHFRIGNLWWAEGDEEGEMVALKYSTRNDTCGQFFLMPTTQDYQLDSSRYGPADDCMWNLNATDSADDNWEDSVHSVQFTLLDLNMTASPNCSTDYLEVLDGLGTHGQALMRVCGNELPENNTVTSESNALTVRLKSSSSHHGNSFRASCTKVRRPVINVAGFGRIARSGSNGSWTLVAKDQSQFIWLELAPYLGYIDLWNGEDNTGKHLLHVSASDMKVVEPRLFISPGPKLHIRLAGISDTRFEASYAAQNFSCGGTLFLPENASGTINSAEYNLTDNCGWFIASLVYSVQLTLDLNIAQNLDCSTDYLEVVDLVRVEGVYRPKRVLTRMCGGNKKRTLAPTSDFLVIRLKSSSSNHNNSFRASYQVQGCGGFKEVSGQERDGDYRNCTWTLNGERENYGVILTEVSFQPRSSSKTEVHDGGKLQAGNEECVNVTYVDIEEEVGSTWQHKGRFCAGRLMDRPILSGPGAGLRVSLATPPNATAWDFSMQYSPIVTQAIVESKKTES